MDVRIVKEERFDVIVCGGGTAGFCAAIAAARMGAKTAVFERFGAFGGTMTVGGVNAPALFHAHGRQIVAGIGWELMTRLAAEGFASLPPQPYQLGHPQMAVQLNAFQAEVEIDRMMKDAGVHVFFHQSVVYAQSRDGRVDCVLVGTVEGLVRATAAVVIDCTGDAVVCAMAGAQIEIARELQPASLNSLIANCDRAVEDREFWMQDYLARVESGDLDAHDVWGMSAAALLRGHGRGRGAGADQSHTVNIGSNLNHVYPFNGADNESRTRGEMNGRVSIARVVRWLRSIPGYENAYVAACAPAVSARESRRVRGNAYITGEDYVNGVVPADAVCYSFYPIDVHSGENERRPLTNVFLGAGRVPGIPLGALIAKGFSNLMMAGRIASGDRIAQSAFRTQASCMAMGEAAGTAAALAAHQGVPVDRVCVTELRRFLKRNGAIVPGMEEPDSRE